MTYNIIPFLIIRECHFIFTRIRSDNWLFGTVMKEQREPEVRIGMAFGRVKDRSRRQCSDTLLPEDCRNLKQNWVSPRQPNENKNERN